MPGSIPSGSHGYAHRRQVFLRERRTALRESVGLSVTPRPLSAGPGCDIDPDLRERQIIPLIPLFPLLCPRTRQLAESEELSGAFERVRASPGLVIQLHRGGIEAAGLVPLASWLSRAPGEYSREDRAYP